MKGILNCIPVKLDGLDHGGFVSDFGWFDRTVVTGFTNHGSCRHAKIKTDFSGFFKMVMLNSNTANKLVLSRKIPTVNWVMRGQSGAGFLCNPPPTAGIFQPKRSQSIVLTEQAGVHTIDTRRLGPRSCQQSTIQQKRLTKPHLEEFCPAPSPPGSAPAQSLAPFQAMDLQPIDDARLKTPQNRRTKPLAAKTLAELREEAGER